MVVRPHPLRGGGKARAVLKNVRTGCWPPRLGGYYQLPNIAFLRLGVCRGTPSQFFPRRGLSGGIRRCPPPTDASSLWPLPLPQAASSGPFPSRLLSLASMSSTLAAYESFLVKNVSTISSLESTLRSITWILPGRFRDAELASEAC